tara:strand:- start:9644 stop:9985 length:342 start_codon:yes stop_codon:yes gene_type:complete
MLGVKFHADLPLPVNEKTGGSSHLKIVKRVGTSYTFGAHTRLGVELEGYLPYVLYTVDGRVVLLQPDRIPAKRVAPPAWLVAEWTLSQARGEPISAYAQAAVAADHPTLRWLG